MTMKTILTTLLAGLAAIACAPAAETCGNGVCVVGAGETCSTCAADCGACAACGDGSCRGGETCSSCASDCGACAGCGDAVCNAATETCTTCAGDCGSCTTTCTPATCAGCCDGDSCVTGASPGACGSGGSACMVCSPGFLCSTGTCSVDPASRWSVVLESLTVPATRYDGAGWDTIGGNPDPLVALVIGSSTATPVNSGSASDSYSVTFTGGPTAMDVRADALQAYLGFNVRDDDSPAASESIGYCVFDPASGSPLPAAAFTEATQTLNCGIDAPTMNSGFMLTWHLERF